MLRGMTRIAFGSLLLVGLGWVLPSCNAPNGGMVCYSDGMCVQADGACLDRATGQPVCCSGSCVAEADKDDVPDDGPGTDDGPTDEDTRPPECESCPVQPGVDDDGDCIANELETAGCTSPTNKDTDGDGILDGCEDRNYDGTLDTNEMNPCSTDTDSDGIPDAIEDKNHNGVRDAGETSAVRPDSDYDGIPDGLEDRNHNGIVDSFVDTNGNGCWDPGEPEGESDPLKPDSDGDLIPDDKEDKDKDGLYDADPACARGQKAPTCETVAWSRDTDCDLLLDGIEDKNHNGEINSGETNPLNPDTDGDCIKDGIEDFKPDLSTEPGVETDPRKVDTDGDGIWDGRYSDPTCTGAHCPLGEDLDCDGEIDPFVDTNGNGCWDEGEPPGETNPRSIDSDGDGIEDGIEDIDHDGRCDREMRPNPANPTQQVLTFTETCAWRDDTDCDGLTEDREDFNKSGGTPDPGETDPRLQDSDLDGLVDGCPPGMTSGCEDVDLDGEVDATETSALNWDTDFDGLSDGCEISAGLNPLVEDSDGDGYSDGEEDPDRDCVFGEAHDLVDGFLMDPRTPQQIPPENSLERAKFNVCSAGNLKELTFAETSRKELNYRLAFEVEDGTTYLTEPFGIDVDGDGAVSASSASTDQLWGHIFQSPKAADGKPNRYVYGFILASEDTRALDDILLSIRNTATAFYDDGSAGNGDEVKETSSLTARPAPDDLPAFRVNNAQRRLAVMTRSNKKSALKVRNDILLNVFLACGRFTTPESCAAAAHGCTWNTSTAACDGAMDPDPRSVPPTIDPAFGAGVDCSTPGLCSDTFAVYIGAVQRLDQKGPNGKPVVLTVVAVTQDDTAGATSEVRVAYNERLTRLEDLTGGSALARVDNKLGKQCEALNSAVAKADMLWVIDDSASMQQLIKRLQVAARDARAALTSNSTIVDYRVAMTTTNSSFAARTRCAEGCTSSCDGSACGVNSCLDQHLGCLYTCPVMNACVSIGADPSKDTCTNNSGCAQSACACYDTDFEPDTCSGGASMRTCADPRDIPAALLTDAQSYPLPGGGGTFYYEHSLYLDCDSSTPVPGINWCGEGPYASEFAPFFDGTPPNLRPKALEDNEGFLRANLAATCQTALMDLSESATTANTTCTSADTSFCCERLTAPCTDGPRVIASQMCDLIRQMGGLPAGPSNDFKPSGRPYSAPEQGTRAARRLIEQMLPALPANYSGTTYVASEHLRLSCCSACDPATDQACREKCCRTCDADALCPQDSTHNCAAGSRYNPATGACDSCCSHDEIDLDCSISATCEACDPRDGGDCPVVPLVSIILSDEEDFWFKDECKALTNGLGSSVDSWAPSQLSIDLTQLPSGCRYVDGDVSTLDTCTEAYCAQFLADPPGGYDPDLPGWKPGNDFLKLRPRCDSSSLFETTCNATPGCTWNAGSSTCSCPHSQLCNSVEGCAWDTSTSSCLPTDRSCSVKVADRDVSCIGDPCPLLTVAECSQWSDICAVAKPGTPAAYCKNHCAMIVDGIASNAEARRVCNADPACVYEQSLLQPQMGGVPQPCVMKYPINDCQPCKRFLRTLGAIKGEEGPSARCSVFDGNQAACGGVPSCVWDGTTHKCVGSKCSTFTTSVACRSSFMCTWDTDASACVPSELIGFGSVGPVYAITRDKGEPGMPKIDGATPADDCKGYKVTWGRGDGSAYRDLAIGTAGRTQNVCDDDYSFFMNEVIKDIVSLSAPYRLAGNPIASTIKVGVAHPTGGTYEYHDVPRSVTQGFTYDPGRNSIGFKSDAVDGKCSHAPPCTDTEEIDFALHAPHVPQEGDIVFISYREWLPVPCQGACHEGEICSRVLCTSDPSAPSCGGTTTCPDWQQTCEGGKCAYDCTPGMVVDRCVPQVQCGLCESFNAIEGKCELNTDDTCICNPDGTLPCNPDVPSSCPMGFHCGESCTCEQNNGCAVFDQGDGSILGGDCNEAIQCCGSWAEQATLCGTKGTREACQAMGSGTCIWDEYASECGSAAATCCIGQEQPLCYYDVENGKFFIQCKDSCICQGDPCATDCAGLSQGDCLARVTDNKSWCVWNNQTSQCESPCKPFQTCEGYQAGAGVGDAFPGRCTPPCQPIKEYCAEDYDCTCRTVTP